MPPKKILVVRQKVKADGSLTLEPVAWKDEHATAPKSTTTPNTECAPRARVDSPSVASVGSPTPQISAPPAPPTPITPVSTSFGVGNVDDDQLSTTPDVDFLSAAPCDTESVTQSVENDKMLTYPEDPMDRDWIGGDFGAEAIDEMLGSSFTVPANQEENLVPELGITEPIEDAALAALKYTAPEKPKTRKKRVRASRVATNDMQQAIQKLTSQKLTARKPMPYSYPCKCELCDKICHTKNQYKSHRFYHHTNNRFLWDGPEERRKCQYCEKTFSMKAAFVKHQRTVHWKELDLEEPRFPCRYCNRIYVASSSRIYHEMTIHRPKCYPCPLCDLEFKAYENLTKHLKTHDASCFRCFKCHNLFSNVDSLRKHFENKHKDVQFHEAFATMNDKARKSLANGTLLQNAKKREMKNPPTMTFENMEKLDDFLKSNPNYQIVQSDENGQTVYQLVELIENAQVQVEKMESEQQEFVPSMTEQCDVELPVNQVEVPVNSLGISISQNAEANVVASRMDTVVLQDGGEERMVVDRPGQVPEFELDSVEEALATMPALQGKLAYRCQTCSMVFADTEALMKHCLVKHQEIAQVVLV